MYIVIGRNGQLATACATQLAARKLPFVCLGSHEVNVFDETELYARLDSIVNSNGDEGKRVQIKALINASAYTAVDKAEDEPEQAYKLNEQVVASLAKYCACNDIFMVHVSTDYVFSGEANQPYLPDETYAPNNTYGQSKMAGEIALLEQHSSRSCILRTSWVYSEHGNNFVKTMLRLMNEKDKLGIVFDQVGSPTSAHTLAKACIEFAEQAQVGVHHICDQGLCSWFDFAVAIQSIAVELLILPKAIPISPILSAQYPTPASRPHYSVLDTSSSRAVLGEGFLPYWRSALYDVLEQIKKTEK